MGKPSITKVARLVLVTADPAAAEDFFALAFDAIVVERREEDAAFSALMGVPSARARQTVLRFGDEEVSLLSFDPPGRPYPAGSTSSDLWFQHFAFIVSDMDAAYARLRRVRRFVPISEGGPQTLPPASGSVVAFKFRDAEGHPLEFLAFPDGEGPEVWQEKRGHGLVLGIDHSAIAVSDTAASVAFFAAAFGLKLAMQSENVGSEQSRMDAVPEARVTVSGLVPVVAPPHVELLGYKVGARRAADSTTRSDDVVATHFVLETADLPTIVEALTEQGARFISPGIVSLADGRPAIMVLDPDGHRFVVTQPRFETPRRVLQTIKRW